LKIEQQVAPSNVSQVRLGMPLEEVFTVCPHLNRRGLPGFDGREHGQDCGPRYVLRYLQVVVVKGGVIEIDFSGGFPKPSGEAVVATVEWLLDIFGPPNSAFERSKLNEARFGLIWKQATFAVACWFSSTDSSFYAFLKIVPASSDMNKILTARGAQELPRTSQAILARLGAWTREIAHLEPKAPAFPTLSDLPVVSAGSSPTAPEKYEVLIGEGFAGSGFVIRYANALFGVCSMHQFEGKTPNTLELLEGDAVQLDSAKVFKQTDVQVLPLKRLREKLPYLAYNPEFTLRPGEEVLILGPTANETGILTATGMTGGSYESKEGPRLLGLRTFRPFKAAGGSGCPVIRKGIGVVGVLTDADDPEKARTVGFETLCLPKFN
jgi:hypothetical protein